MAISTVSKRYARALLDIGIEEKRFEAYGTELRDIYAVSLGNPEISFFQIRRFTVRSRIYNDISTC